MNYILFDDANWNQLLPLTYTRPIAELRVGILSLKQKWDKYLKTNCSYFTQEYLATKYSCKINADNLFINASLLPSAELISEIENLEQGQALISNKQLIAVRLNEDDAKSFDPNNPDNYKAENCISSYTQITRPWHIFSQNGEEISRDFKLLTKGRKSQPLSQTNTVLGSHDVFLERGAKVECSTINTSNGPVYIGKDAEIMENTAIRGPFALCEHSTIKMAAKIYGPTTIGPHCKVGGELNNVVLLGYSNKAHDGFLGNSVIGEWCNLGADTNNSNLKNNYAEVKLWSYLEKRFVKTGLQFCGLIMGDHSKCGINTMFNTGTVVGVAANIFGDGFPRNFIPSFAWGGASGFTECRINKAFEIAELVLDRRGLEFNKVEQDIMQSIFDNTAQYRESFNA